jgi:plastocyanin
MGDGQIYQHTFDTKGTLTYHCSIHPFMKGSVEVK